MKRRRSAKPAPRPAGPFELAISDLAADARGVGHSDGKAVFVADALPGERIEYLRTRQHRNHDEGQLQNLLQPAQARVEPRCPHFGDCGGCVLQHLAPEGQIEFKQDQVRNNLQRIGKVEPQNWLPPVTGALWNYRRRARLAAKHVPKKGGTLVGFRERNNPRVAVLRGCDVLISEVGTRILALQQLIDSLSICDQVPQIEVAGGDNGVALVVRVLRPPNADDRDKLAAFSRDTGLWLYLQPGGLETVTPLLENTPRLYYELPDFDVRITFEPTDFVQIHGAVNTGMVRQAVELLDVGADDCVLELFSGIGNFTLPLARRAGRVISVESEAGLVARAQENARHSGLHNIVPYQDDLFAAPPNPAWAGQAFNKVLLDPPRAGAREVIPALAAKKPTHILYCSCHPATLARDAATLVHEYGYTLTHAGVLDMFPHTAHVEAMALFERT